MPQNPNEIANPQSPYGSQGPEMNDRDRLNDILATEKYLTDGLNSAVREASHDALFQDLMGILNETHQMARDIYNTMFQQGWYTLEAEQPQKLQQTFQQFQGYSTQFPYH
ncbi:spore coat protein [Alicyclobacillus shizuokensis]|uniref:spore coat protein n=1 Tax=Alicyclobacillus shizuokensis TaxID=392014 RepID=UPI00082BFF07|nr:spore coat protein [Alicyclobacillus shizuokensis]MCL6626643.1 spore coat protein [Alicyclobacillus shizuokensis]